MATLDTSAGIGMLIKLSMLVVFILIMILAVMVIADIELATAVYFIVTNNK